MLHEDDDADWSTTVGGFRIPRLDVVNQRLEAHGVERLDDDDLERIYVEYLNGD
jgi:hypothetical protein